MLLFGNSLPEGLQRQPRVVIRPSEPFRFRFQDINLRIDLFLLIVQSSDFFSELVFLGELFLHGTGILSDGGLSSLLALVYISDQGPLLIEKSSSL